MHSPCHEHQAHAGQQNLWADSWRNVRYRVLYNGSAGAEYEEGVWVDKEMLSCSKIEGDSFIQFISDKSIAPGGSYRQTWSFIQKETNSLKRYTNMGIIFEEEENIGKGKC